MFLRQSALHPSQPMRLPYRGHMTTLLTLTTMAEVERTENSFDGLDESVKRVDRGRKRKRINEPSKREKAKLLRYSGEGLTPRISCNHARNGELKEGMCRANSLSQRSLQLGFVHFFQRPVKFEQDVIISNLLHVKGPERIRVPLQERQKGRHVTVTYHLKDFDTRGAPLVTVCKQSFLSAFGGKC